MCFDTYSLDLCRSFLMLNLLLKLGCKLTCFMFFCILWLCVWVDLYALLYFLLDVNESPEVWTALSMVAIYAMVSLASAIMYQSRPGHNVITYANAFLASMCLSFFIASWILMLYGFFLCYQKLSKNTEGFVFIVLFSQAAWWFFMEKLTYGFNFILNPQVKTIP